MRPKLSVAAAGDGGGRKRRRQATCASNQSHGLWALSKRCGTCDMCNLFAFFAASFGLTAGSKVKLRLRRELSAAERKREREGRRVGETGNTAQICYLSKAATKATQKKSNQQKLD